jgi:hypothetical protein
MCALVQLVIYYESCEDHDRVSFSDVSRSKNETEAPYKPTLARFLRAGKPAQLLTNH